MTRARGAGDRALPGLVSLSLLLVAAIHLMPLVGVLGPARLGMLYGLDFGDPNLAILMRHRAVLFGLLGTYFAFAAFRRRLQPMALLVATISVVSFLALAWSTGSYNAAVGRVVVADLVALVTLLVGGLALLAARRGGTERSMT